MPRKTTSGDDEKDFGLPSSSGLKRKSAKPSDAKKSSEGLDEKPKRRGRPPKKNEELSVETKTKKASTTKDAADKAVKKKPSATIKKTSSPRSTQVAGKTTAAKSSEDKNSKTASKKTSKEGEEKPKRTVTRKSALSSAKERAKKPVSKEKAAASQRKVVVVEGASSIDQIIKQRSQAAQGEKYRVRQPSSKRKKSFLLFFFIGLLLLLFVGFGMYVIFNRSSADEEYEDANEPEETVQEHEQITQPEDSTDGDMVMEEKKPEQEPKVVPDENIEPETTNEEEQMGSVTYINTPDNNYYLVIASFIDEDLANDYANKLSIQGEVTTFVLGPKNEDDIYHKVAVYQSETKSGAQEHQSDYEAKFEKKLYLIKYSK